MSTVIEIGTAANVSERLQMPEGKLTLTASRTFMVSDYLPLSEADVVASGPAIGAAHPHILWLVATSKNAKPIRKDLTAWHLTVSYESVSLPSGWTEDPTTRPPLVSWTSVEYEVDFLKDAGTGDKVLNSAGDAFDPPPKKRAAYWQCVYKKNFAVPYSKPFSYINTVNSSSVVIDGKGFTAKQLLLAGISIDPEQVENGVAYRPVTYTFLYKEETWDMEILDQGVREKAGTSLRHIRIGGEPVTEPVLLNGAGAFSGTTPHFLTFQPYETRDFNSIL